MNCLAARTAATSSGWPVTQPIFQPVNENVLPPELIDTVRSGMPGRVAIGTCSPVYTRCSYTSSVTTSRSRVTAIRAMAVISSRVNTAPVGLCGELSRMARVRGVTAARSASRSGRKPGGRSVTGTRTPPAMAIEAA
jgi:hypothetical protein